MPGSPVDELIVNGVFAMDSAHTDTERALAAWVPASSGAIATGTDRLPRVLIGGLGLGYTAAAVLERDVMAVDVVELEPCLVSWARAGVTATLAQVAADPRCQLHVGDVADVFGGRAEPSGRWDAILLDVDNGPDFLIHAQNEPLYGEPMLAAAYRQLHPGGVLALWSQGPSPLLMRRLNRIAAGAREHRHAVQRDGRQLEYALYTLHRPDE